MKSLLVFFALVAASAHATEFHVSPQGKDTGAGTAAAPFRTIQHAADAAQPGDTITVHAGTYREAINPPRGGTSDAVRITYRAAAGEKAIIKGSEVVTGWTKVQNGVWKVSLPDSFFKGYNPYVDVLHGDWLRKSLQVNHTGEVFLNGVALHEGVSPDDVNKAGVQPLWCCSHQDGVTQIWANFGEADPNKELVEITTRPTCFYPQQTGRNFITVRGFTFAQAATQWVPPTTEQVGLLGTDWSKGWIIEDNVISDAKCVGITLGKDATREDYGGATAGAYTKVIDIAVREGWSKETIGSHIVRNNTIFNCGQAGICGSLGAVFSQVIHNHVYNIHRNQAFSGAEIACLKFHAAIDMLIKDNCLHDADRGLWLDWMAQGTHVTGNLCYHNTVDVFCEVDHGPYLLDNNILLSNASILSHSEGGAYVHNFIFGRIMAVADQRVTPYFEPHSATIAGSKNLVGGDDRYVNNVIWGANLKDLYGKSPEKNPVIFSGNIYGPAAQPPADEANSLQLPASTATPQLITEGDSAYLQISYDPSMLTHPTTRVTTASLGTTITSKAAYESADGQPLTIDHDYTGKSRAAQNPTAGPFETPGTGPLKIKIWDLAKK